MATINLASYKVVSQELSSSVKFNNLVQAIQDGLSLGTTDLGVAIITFGAAADTNLYRSAANYLKTDDNFQTALAIESYVGNAGQITLAAPGSVPTIYFGSAVDTNLYRSAADILQSDDTIRSTRAAVANTAFSAKTDADGSSRLRIEAGGKMEWGDGTTVDTNLYRAAANQLKSDDLILSALGIAVKTKAGAPVDGDYGAELQDGIIVQDITNHRLYVRSNGLWKYAAQT
jgi:hypothetical protein